MQKITYLLLCPLVVFSLSFNINKTPCRIPGYLLKAQQEWDSLTIAKANTAIDADYLSEEEKKVIFLTNMARTNGPLFAETYLTAFLELSGSKPNQYTKSLINDLQEVKDLPMLIPETDLYKAARGHALQSGRTGHTGHKGFKSRYKPLMQKYMAVGENCYYGSQSAMEIVIKLMIDEGIKDLGHRKNMFDRGYNSIGVSIKPHKVYQYNCVMSFGRTGRSYKDYIIQ